MQVIPRMIFQIFEGIAQGDPEVEYQVMVSYIEIYMEKVRDLLNPANDNLNVREDKRRGVYIQDVQEPYATSAEDVFHYFRAGSGNRSVGATRMNEGSSRSHSIFIVTVMQRHKNGSSKQGVLYTVDLAGSEMIKKTLASGQRLEVKIWLLNLITRPLIQLVDHLTECLFFFCLPQEAKMINKSLSALGGVINALTDGKSKHIPYRDSKLTRCQHPPVCRAPDPSLTPL